MSKIIRKQEDLKSTSYEIFILQLSLLSLVNLLALLIPGTKPIFKDAIKTMDLFISVIFMGDFLYRLLTARSKSTYFFRDWGWADLLASMPFQEVKIFRLFRVVRVIRLLRSVGIRNMWSEIRNSRADSALYMTIFLVILVLEFSVMMIIAIEGRIPEANIKTASDAIWWGYVTITTVGYGDHFPITNLGRAVGILLLTAGVGLFGVLTGFLANAFLAPEKEQDTDIVAGDEANDLDRHALVAELSGLLDEQTQSNIALRNRLAALEAALSGQT